MASNDVFKQLQAVREQFSARYGVKHLTLFGSHARGDAGADRDVDLLVEFSNPATFDGYMAFKFYLEDLLGRPVDLVTSKAVRRELRPHIEKDAIRVS